MAATITPEEILSDNPDPTVLQTIGAGAGKRRRLWLRSLLASLLILTIPAILLIRHFRSGNALPRYETAPSLRGDLEVTVSATGSVEPVNTVEIGSEVTGRAVEVLVDYNEQVHAGQVLAILDREQLAASADQAQAQVLVSEATVRQAVSTLIELNIAQQRTRRLFAARLTSSEAVEAATAAVVRARDSLVIAAANSAVSRASLVVAQSRLDKTVIVSPIDGVVLFRQIEAGQTVTAGFQTPILFRLAEDLRAMRLHVDVDEADIGRVREGQIATFTVEAYGGKTFVSRVVSVRLEPRRSQNVVTYEAVLEVDNQEGWLLPGMTATARIVTATREGVILVPNAALRFEPPATTAIADSTPPLPQSPRLFTLRAGLPHPVSVSVGVSDGFLTEIRGGQLPVGVPVILDLALED